MKKAGLSLYSISLIIFFSLNLYANKDKPLHVSIHNIPPISYYENNKFKGPMITIVDQLLKDLNMKGEYHLIPWARTLSMAREAFPTLIIRHSMNKDRKTFLKPILIGFEARKVQFIKNKNQRVLINSYKDLTKYKVGVKRGFFYSDNFNSQKLKKETVNNDLQAFKMLSRGRIDLFATYSFSELKTLLKSNGVDFDKHYELISFSEDFENPYYFSIPLNSSILHHHKPISCQILKYRKNGFITKAFKDLNLPPLTQDFQASVSKKQAALCK